MDSQLFFIINSIAAIILVWWFLSARRGNSKISSLDLKKGSLFKEDAVPSKVTLKPTSGDRVKTLNVLFMYNGHDWDAYEVLGLPAGCGLTLVTQRYQELIREAEEGKLLFYQAAYDAILKKQ